MDSTNSQTKKNAVEVDSNDNGNKGVVNLEIKKEILDDDSSDVGKTEVCEESAITSEENLNVSSVLCADAKTLFSENVASSSDSKHVLEADMKSRLLGFGLSPAAKRRHNVLSLDTKLEVIKRLESGESVAFLAKQYNIGRATIFDIKNKKESILSFATKLNNNNELKTRKTVRKVPGKSLSQAAKKKEKESIPSSSDPKIALCVYGTTPTNKRKHNVLSIETKIEIIQRLEKGESGASLAPLYNVGRATISDIKNKRDDILMFASKLKSEDGLKKRKTMRKANDICLENAMYTWYQQKLNQGEVVTGPLLCEKALELNGKLGGPSDFKASTGWLKNFRSRHGIKTLQNDYESDAVAVLSSEKANRLKSYVDLLQQEGYAMDDMYAADETVVDWQTMPENSVVYQRLIVEQQVPSDPLTVLACANLIWTHTLPLLVIGKNKPKKCFGKISCLPILYKRQKNGWMNSEIFMEWYAKEFIPRVKREREMTGKYGKVLLLLDGAPYHPAADLLNVVDDNFHVMFLPSNVTTFSHPMDGNTIKRMKRMVKKQILRRLLLATEDEETTVSFARQFTLKECCYMLADSWSTVSQQNVQETWKKMWSDVEKTDPSADAHACQKDMKEFAELFKAIPGFSKCSLENAREWLKIDLWDPGYQLLNEDEIITSVMNDEQDDDSEDSDAGKDDGDNNMTYPTHSEAFNSFDIAMEWCEQQKECTPEQLILLKRLKDLAAKKMWITPR